MVTEYSAAIVVEKNGDDCERSKVIEAVESHRRFHS
jgi:hypothetical protein